MVARGAVFLALLLLAALPCGAQNYSDIWWNPLESGWGITIADHDTQLFAVWYTYDTGGQPTWFVIPGGSFDASRTVFTGDMYQTTGPAYSTLPFDPARVAVTRVGTASFDFAPPATTPAGFATFTYSIGSTTQTKNIQRQPFGNAPPWWAIDRTDIWWNAAESGWGLTLAQHGNNVFGVWYTYGANGKPLFVVLPGVTFNGSDAFNGALYTTTGPSYTSLFNPGDVRVTQVGNASLTFSGDTGTFTSTVNGVTQSHAIVRQPFGRSAPLDTNPGGETWRQRGIAVGFEAGNMPEGVGTLIMAEVVRLADGTYRMYFTASPIGSVASDIWVAESPDATAWTVRGKALAGSSNPADPEYAVQGASLVNLPDGRWRMYYDATPTYNIAQNVPPSYQLFSAISSDGISFQREGVRIANAAFAPGSPLISAAHGRVLAMPSGGYEAYLSAKPNDSAAPQGVYQFHSDDGLAFGAAQLVLATAHDPVVLAVGNGFTMYADPSPDSGFTAIDHAVKLASQDGVSWTAPQPAVFVDAYGSPLHLGNNPQPAIGDLGAVVLGSGKVRLFSNYNVQNLAFYDLQFAQ